MMISIEDYFAAYKGHHAITAHIREAAEDLLDRVNALLYQAQHEGVTLDVNRITGTQVSGSANGGWRPPECPIGAPQSSHKEGRAVDIYDPNDGDLDGWCMDHLDVLEDIGLWLEHPASTRGWCHLTTRRPRSGNRVFYP